MCVTPASAGASDDGAGGELGREPLHDELLVDPAGAFVTPAFRPRVTKSEEDGAGDGGLEFCEIVEVATKVLAFDGARDDALSFVVLEALIDVTRCRNSDLSVADGSHHVEDEILAGSLNDVPAERMNTASFLKLQNRRLLIDIGVRVRAFTKG